MARPEIAATLPSTPLVTEARPSWTLWAFLVTPLALVVLLVLGVFETTARTGTSKAETIYRPSRSSSTSEAPLEASPPAAPTTATTVTTAGSTGTGTTGARPTTPILAPGIPAAPAGGSVDPASSTPAPVLPPPPRESPGSNATTTTTASPGTTRPSIPQTPDDCKNGGWAALVDDQGRPFPNQGACVSFVNGR
jgi:hypothetical protein